MNVKEFRSKIKPNIALLIEDQSFIVKEVVKFEFDDGTYYIKCWLNNDYVLADDLDRNMFILVNPINTGFKQPFPEELTINGRKFSFLYTAHAIAVEIQGEPLFKIGESERFWDYKASNDEYLSLGINDKTDKRMDFYGRIIENSKIDFK